ncbi:MAG: hypothetical protein WCC48_00625 [Anaeromyxobacteraceae bacterium]
MSLLAPLLSLLSGALPAASAGDPGPGPASDAESMELPLKGSELAERADAELARLRRAFEDVLSRVADARIEKDLVKLLCADDKLSRLKVLVAVAERAEVALAEAISARDVSVMIEYSKIAIARGKADALRAEAAACIGRLAYEVEEKTSVYVEMPEYLPKVGEPDRAQDARGGDRYRHAFGIPSAAMR